MVIFDISLLFSSRCTCTLSVGGAGLTPGTRVGVAEEEPIIYTRGGRWWWEFSQTEINKFSRLELFLFVSTSCVSFLNFTNKKFAVIGWNTVPFQPVLRIRIRDLVLFLIWDGKIIRIRDPGRTSQIIFRRPYKQLFGLKIWHLKS